MHKENPGLWKQHPEGLLQGGSGSEILCACREDREDFDLKAAEGSTGKRGRPEGAGAGGGGGGGGGGGKRVFANNLAEETTWQALKDYFKQAGPVAHADVLAVCLTHFDGSESRPKKILVGRCGYT